VLISPFVFKRESRREKRESTAMHEHRTWRPCECKSKPMDIYMGRAHEFAGFCRFLTAKHIITTSQITRKSSKRK